MRSLANKIGHLVQGIRGIAGTNTIHYIHKNEIPKNRLRDVTYGRIMVSYPPQKSKPHGSRLTVEGYQINYPFDPITSTADLPTIKMLWNSVLSTENTKFVTLDISNFYLGTPMDRLEYMRLLYKVLPAEIKEAYKLEERVTDRWVYVKMTWDMYGLLHA